MLVVHPWWLERENRDVMADAAQINIDRYLRTVLAVAEERQITRAAIRLGKAQPWVSRQLRALEEEVGVKLFKRMHKGVEATPSGEALVKEAQQAILHSQRSVFKARSASATVTDKLLIGVSPTFDPDVYESVRGCLRSGLPRMEVVFGSKFVTEQRERILRTELHLGLAELPVQTTGLQVLLLKRERMFLAGSRGEPLLVAAFNESGLNRKPCILLASEANPYQKRIIEFLVGNGMYSENIREVLTVSEAVYPVMRGKAIAILPSLAAKLGFNLMFRPIDGLHVDYGVIFHEDHRNAAIRTLLPILQRHFAEDRAIIHSQRGMPEQRHRKAVC